MCYIRIMLNAAIIKQIEEHFGKPIKYPKDCEGLSKAIQIQSNKLISFSTLKRLFGFVKQVEQPHTYTLDIIANYIGYKNWEEALRFIEGQDNSSFFQVEGIDVGNLKKGNKIEFTYDPKRNVVLLYKGKNLFVVESSKNSKLLKGDVLTFTYIAISHPLITSEVIRNKISIGKFTGGKTNGITSIKIID
jgi:hypothetical protein